MPRDLSKYVSTIQWETISTPDEAIELWLIANADNPGQCQLSCVYLSVKLRTPQFTTGDLREAVSDMKRIGSVMVAYAPGDEGPYEYLVYTGGAWDHDAQPDQLPVTMDEPAPPHAYVVLYGDPMDGYTVYGAWADKATAEWWARNNVAPGPDWFVVPMTHAYP
jgi:hypothetical protein